MSWKDWLEEEKRKANAAAAEAASNIKSMEQQAIAQDSATADSNITGVIHSPNIKKDVYSYKRDQADYDDIIGRKSTWEEFINYNPAYTDFAIDYSTSFALSLDEFHNLSTDKRFWNEKFRNEDQEVLKQTNESLFSNAITAYVGLDNQTVPRLGYIPELHDRSNVLGFQDKTLGKGTAMASLYPYESETYRKILQQDIIDRMPEERKSDFIVVPVEQATAETIGTGADFSKNYAIYDMKNNVYELVNEKGATDNITAFVTSLATPEMAVNVAADVALGMATRNPYYIGGGLAFNAYVGYGGVKDYVSNPMRLEGTGYEDPDKFKEGTNAMIAVASPLLGMWGFASGSASNLVKKGINVDAPPNVKRAIEILEASGYKPEEILTAGNFSGYLKTLENQSKALQGGNKGAVFEAQTKQQEVFGEMFAALIGADGKTIDDVMRTLNDSELIKDVYIASESLILSDTTMKVLGKSTIDDINYNVEVGEQMSNLWRTNNTLYKNIKSSMFDTAELQFSELLDSANSFGYQTFFEIPATTQKEILDIIRGIDIPQASGTTQRRDIAAEVLEEGKDINTPIAQGQPFPNRVIGETEAFEMVSQSRNLPPINWSNIQSNYPDIANMFTNILGIQRGVDGQFTFTKGAGLSASPDTPMVAGIFGGANGNAFQTLRALEKELTKKISQIREETIATGGTSSTAEYSAKAGDLIKLREKVWEIMSVENIKKVKTEAVGGQDVRGMVVPFGQSNSESYQVIQAALQSAKDFTRSHEQVFNTVLYKTLAKDTAINEMPSKIMSQFNFAGSSSSDIAMMENFVRSLYTQIDTLTPNNLSKYYPDNIIPKNVQKWIDDGMTKKEAFKKDFRESFAGHLIQMTDGELDNFLQAANKNKTLFKTMFGDEADQVYNNLKLMNQANITLNQQMSLVYKPQGFIRRQLDSIVNDPKKMVDFFEVYKPAAAQQEQMVSIYLNNIMQGAFKDLAPDGSNLLNIKAASNILDQVLIDSAKQGNPLNKIITSETRENIINLKFLMDTIALEGMDMGSSLITASIAADVGKVAKPRVAAYALWQIFKYDKIGAFLSSETAVKLLMREFSPADTKITGKNIAVSEAVVPMWQIYQAMSNQANEEDYEWFEQMMRATGMNNYTLENLTEPYPTSMIPR